MGAVEDRDRSKHLGELVRLGCGTRADGRWWRRRRGCREGRGRAGRLGRCGGRERRCRNRARRNRNFDADALLDDKVARIRRGIAEFGTDGRGGHGFLAAPRSRGALVKHGRTWRTPVADCGGGRNHGRADTAKARQRRRDPAGRRLESRRRVASRGA